MKHTHSFLLRSLMAIGGMLGLGALLAVPAAATSQDDATTTTTTTTSWTANFQAVNSTPRPPKEWNITLSFGCRDASETETKVARGDTLDVACVVETERAYMAYTVEWAANSVKQTHVEEHDGTVWHSCEQDETARVTFTDVGRPPLNPTVTYSTECVSSGGSDSADDDPT